MIIITRLVGRLFLLLDWSGVGCPQPTCLCGESTLIGSDSRQAVLVLLFNISHGSWKFLEAISPENKHVEKRLVTIGAKRANEALKYAVSLDGRYDSVTGCPRGSWFISNVNMYVNRSELGLGR